MKPLEVLLALPKWGKATPDEIIDSPAFAMPCRLGEENVTLKAGAVLADDTLNLGILLGDERHTLRIARSPRFAELDKLWDSRADVPAPILLALVEKDCGPLLQLLENATRRQLRLAGLADESASPDERMLFAQVSDISFALTRSDAVTAAFGILRHIDLSSPEVRSETLPAEAEYSSFALSAADIASLAVGDALLLPEIGSVPPRLVADGRFVAEANGVSQFSDDGLCRVLATETRTVTLGELFDATDGESSPIEVPAAGAGAQLRLVQNGKTLANGRLDRIGDQNAFVVEARG